VPLAINTSGARLRFSAMRRLLTGTQVVGQRVTDVVRREDAPPGGRHFVAFRAVLVEPYLVRLHEPALYRRIHHGRDVAVDGASSSG
jgi:hypothetical protein